MPWTLTKQAAASPPTSPSAGTASTAKARKSPRGAERLESDPRNTSHSETKPFRGGSPLMAAAPTRKRKAVSGMRRERPPSRSMSRVPQAWWTAPAPRNRSDLKVAWFTTWSAAPANPSSTSAWSPRERPSSARPTPMAMIPTFSTLW